MRDGRTSSLRFLRHFGRGAGADCRYAGGMYPRPRRIIVAQYTAPKFVSLMAAAELLGEGKRAIAAQVVDLAVRKVISIAREPGGAKKSGFTLTIVGDPLAEQPDEQAALRALFPSLDQGATRRVAPGRNKALGAALQGPHRFAVARLITADLAREKSLLVKLFQPWRKQPVVPTAKAYPIVDHLWGIHDFVRLVEKERFAMLQSPQGAERTPVGELEVLKLYEKLLPYAVLFGLEKQWMKELDLYARELSPDLLATLDTVADVTYVAASVAELALDLGNLADLVDVSDALEGVGAIFGGIAEFLGSLSP